eukprot:1161740-Pelagomonas_calceolata.AAC.8
MAIPMSLDANTLLFLPIQLISLNTALAGLLPQPNQGDASTALQGSLEFLSKQSVRMMEIFEGWLAWLRRATQSCADLQQTAPASTFFQHDRSTVCFFLAKAHAMRLHIQRKGL